MRCGAPFAGKLSKSAVSRNRSMEREPPQTLRLVTPGRNALSARLLDYYRVELLGGPWKYRSSVFSMLC
ncbi:MAG: hypothetical protein F6K50_11520 [Moorea sp. SIO3I7]|uniref:hypothetical protein n=1 Tax=unclassified Moorena TaxID=2683338 RepID=UPI0013BFF00E|nr:MULTISPECIES: hypothetical protein [unclassified Moorena]NEN96135.1 hypothetical protein [Moorena sp. SIO3I7]NEO07661.1 hypothetical protein [Moorena sp. SIO3I8]NEO19611.1 hypothetical protein [Moorena sp. SIO4A5]NEQ59808.1 hypothetical protein [Moorena sp. SIO4A1]